ncbi:MAG: hypothetical protein J0I09_00030 [Sphingobacteriia bacterium]|nr:hypothetical protein [Sphingobacteriia bacterium]
MTQFIKYLTIIKRHGFLIWAICILILGLLITFDIFGSNGDLSKTSGIGMALIGVIAILYSFYCNKKNIRP